MLSAVDDSRGERKETPFLRRLGVLFRLGAAGFISRLSTSYAMGFILGLLHSRLDAGDSAVCISSVPRKMCAAQTAELRSAGQPRAAAPTRNMGARRNSFHGHIPNMFSKILNSTL